MPINLIIRQEEASNKPVIKNIHDQAFRQPNEGKLVQELRNHPAFDPGLSLVADLDSIIVGHILFFPIFIRTENDEFQTLSLGPVAVLPEFQSRGIGGKLILSGHETATKFGYKSVVLLGHPSYYPRFGYKIAAFWNLTNPWGIHNEAFMAIELNEGYLDDKPGLCVYPEVFNDAA